MLLIYLEIILVRLYKVYLVRFRRGGKEIAPLFKPKLFIRYGKPFLVCEKTPWGIFLYNMHFKLIGSLIPWHYIIKLNNDLL